SRDLAREHGIAREPALLAALDLAVPIGALDQPHHEAPARTPREVGEPVDQRQAALLVSLYGKTEAIPARERGVERQRLDEVEREVEPLGFLGIDRKADALGLRVARQREHERRQLLDRALALRLFVARMQCRELDRDAGRREHVSAGGSATDRGDRSLVALEIAPGVGGGARGLAEHVVGMAIALLLRGSRTLQRLGDGAAHDELPAEDAHGGGHGLAYHRLAGARHPALQYPSEVAHF